MSSERKVWTRLGEIAVVGAALGCASMASAASLPQAIHTALATPAAVALAAQGMSSSTTAPKTKKRREAAALSAEGGEGGGEGDGAATTSAITDDVLYLNLLGQVQGHLTVGVALYEAGANGMALMHMKHPGDELYATIKPALDARRASDFAPALAALAKAVERNAPLAEVTSALTDLELALAKSGSVVDTRSIAGTRLRLAAVHSLIRTAADEYAEGVKDGQIVNGHEYQDAFGFTRVARAMLNELSDEQRAAAADPITEIEAQVAMLLSKAWPNIVPPDTIETDATLLYGAAARIELAYRSVK